MERVAGLMNTTTMMLIKHFGAAAAARFARPIGLIFSAAASAFCSAGSKLRHVRASASVVLLTGRPI